MNLKKKMRLLKARGAQNIKASQFVCKRCGNFVYGIIYELDGKKLQWCPICDQPTRKGRKEEIKFAKRTGGKLTPASGAVSKKGDIWVQNGNDFVTIWELKSTNSDKIVIKLEWFLKGLKETQYNQKFKIHLVLRNSHFNAEIVQDFCDAPHIIYKKKQKQHTFGIGDTTPVCLLFDVEDEQLSIRITKEKI